VSSPHARWIASASRISFACSIASFRSSRIRTVMEGEPLVLIENGNVLDRNLRRARIAREELAEEARLSQVRSLTDVAWAVLETSGKISIIPKDG